MYEVSNSTPLVIWYHLHRQKLMLQGDGFVGGLKYAK